MHVHIYIYVYVYIYIINIIIHIHIDMYMCIYIYICKFKIHMPPCLPVDRTFSASVHVMAAPTMSLVMHARVRSPDGAPVPASSNCNE